VAKGPGAEGPINEAVSRNHVYVYGTAGNPSQDELASRRAQAASAADWSADRGMMGRLMIFPRYLSDKELRQSDYQHSNLVLFGTSGTNDVIAKLADRLPMHLKEGTTGYGLLYIYPVNNRYVLISSGLPWWTPPKKQTQQTGYNFMNSKIDMLKNFQDFILFKDSPDNVIIQGRFDNNWKIPAEAAAVLKASGVIELK
ncbi:MAG: phospholipase, partial [Bacteroidales bacterium]|nr:phospholipase [Bacteroidales bacterium]